MAKMVQARKDRKTVVLFGKSGQRFRRLHNPQTGYAVVMQQEKSFICMHGGRTFIPE
jgi:hypothetical protein